MSDSINLFCLNQGESTEKLFVVDIEKDKTVAHLRKAIKKEKEIFYRNIDANDLVIWKVNIPVNDGDMQTNFALENNKEKGVQKLDCPVNKISDIFTETPATDHIHIIIEMVSPQGNMAKKYGEAMEKLYKALEDGIENVEDLVNDVEKYRKLACYEEALAEDNDLSQIYNNEESFVKSGDFSPIYDDNNEETLAKDVAFSTSYDDHYRKNVNSVNLLDQSTETSHLQLAMEDTKRAQELDPENKLLEENFAVTQKKINESNDDSIKAQEIKNLTSDTAIWTDLKHMGTFK
ncbi:22160_t:CDS:2 [Dentiscutata erythropus]|uniref:22160_t:CDS:1 n=1 Tax=Dentiscutata erythropus TaxID=1348616 RepID=A0A9N9FER4_9GLOM|nr:22160_t:CDS:2 [Dentiscutata erythropus]